MTSTAYQPPSAEPSVDVFVRSMPDDEAFARRLTTALRLHGYTVLLDRDLPEWGSGAPPGMLETTAVVAISSRASRASEAFRRDRLRLLWGNRTPRKKKVGALYDVRIDSTRIDKVGYDFTRWTGEAADDCLAVLLFELPAPSGVRAPGLPNRAADAVEAGWRLVQASRDPKNVGALVRQISESEIELRTSVYIFAMELARIPEAWSPYGPEAMQASAKVDSDGGKALRRFRERISCDYYFGKNWIALDLGASEIRDLQYGIDVCLVDPMTKPPLAILENRVAEGDPSCALQLAQKLQRRQRHKDEALEKRIEALLLTAADGGLSYVYGMLAYRARMAGDDAREVQWLSKGAAAGDADSRGRLAELLEQGELVEKNPEKAFTLYKAAAREYPEYATRAGQMLWDGVGTPRDRQAAVRLFFQAANWSDGAIMDAMVHLGDLYRDGLGGVTPSLSEAITWYRAAMRYGDVPAKSASLVRLSALGASEQEPTAEDEEINSKFWSPRP